MERKTLGDWLRIAQDLGLTEGVAFLQARIAASPAGEADEVIVDDSQMLLLLGSLETTASR